MMNGLIYSLRIQKNDFQEKFPNIGSESRSNEAYSRNLNLNDKVLSKIIPISDDMQCQILSKFPQQFLNVGNNE